MSEQTHTIDDADLLHYILFSVSDNTLCFDVASLREVITVDRIYPVPLVAGAILGVINLRGLIVPVIDPCMRFFGHPGVITKTSRILVTELADGSELIPLGLLVDDVMEVIDIPPDALEPAPAFGNAIRSDFLAATIKYNDGHVLLLNMAKTLDLLELEAYADAGVDYDRMAATDMVRSDATPDEEPDDAEESDENNIIVFTVGSDLYGIPANRLVEITVLGAVMPVPQSQPFMKGVFNLRGTAVPLVDFGLRCNLTANRSNKTPMVLVVETSGVMIGLIIDALSDLKAIGENAIQRIPHYRTTIDRDFVQGVVEQGGLLIIILDIDRILSTEELEELKRPLQEEVLS